MKINLSVLAVVSGMLFVGQAYSATCRAPQPTICDRTCWNAREPQCSISFMSSLNRAVIHHTASPSDYSISSLSDAKSRVRAEQNYHMDVNGWCDIGYNYLVDKLGDIFTGRKYSTSDYAHGAHDGCNSNSYGFSCMGYFHSPYNNAVTSAMLTSLRKVIAWRMPTGWDATGAGSAYCNGITDKVCGHRQVSATACPGDLLDAKTKDGSGFENDINALRTCP